MRNKLELAHEMKASGYRYVLVAQDGSLNPVYAETANADIRQDRFGRDHTPQPGTIMDMLTTWPNKTFYTYKIDAWIDKLESL